MSPRASTGEPQYAGFTVPDPPKRDSLARALAVSPAGDRVLYTRHCVARLRELDTGEERQLGRRLGALPSSWSPDASHFVLQRTWWHRCRSFGPPPVYDILFAGEGDRIGNVLGEGPALSHGHGVTWSNDSRWLLLSDQPTGTAVAGYEMLHAVSVEQRTRNIVVEAGLIDSPFVGPGDWIVYSQYHDYEGASRGNESGAVYVGKLVESER